MKIILKCLWVSVFSLFFLTLGYFAFEYADRFLPLYIIGFVLLWYAEGIIAFFKNAKFKKIFYGNQKANI